MNFAYQSFYPGAGSFILWVATVRSCIRGPLTAQHYAVDMFLAVVVTGLVWHSPVCEWVYPAGAASRLRRRAEGSPPDPRGPLQWLLTALVFAVIAVLAVIIIIGGA